MKFAIEPDVINSNDKELLNRIWYGIKYPHEFAVLSDEQYDAWLDSNWLDSVTDDTATKIKQSMLNWEQSAQKPLVNCCLINLHGQNNTFKPDEAILFLSQTFQIFVENSSTDGNFLLALINHFPNQSKQIIRFKDKLQFTISMGGGSTLIDALRTKMSELGKIFEFPSKFVRFFVLVDSDKKKSSELLKNELLTLSTYCKSNSIPFHVLEKREMDNYLPDILVEKLNIACSANFLEKYRRLSEIDKDYLNLEEDSKWDSRVLKKNFKKFIGELWSDPDLTQEALLQRCNHHSDTPGIHPYNKRELPDLLKKISDLL